MLLDEIIDEINEEYKSDDFELIIKQLILKLIYLHLKKQNKRFIYNDCRDSSNKNGLSSSYVYAPDGFDKLNGETIMKIILNKNYNEISYILENTDFRNDLSKKYPTYQILLIITTNGNRIQRAILGGNFNICIWGIEKLNSLYKEYKKEINDFKRDIFKHNTQKEDLMINRDKIKFQTYQWSIGTTSFRVSELKYKIEKQLLLLKKLFLEYPDKSWGELQSIYFDYLVKNDLAKKRSSNPRKDARQITSLLKDLGLINRKRRLANVGEKIYEIAGDRDYNNDNIFFIRNDSFIYLKQLLKLELTNSNYCEFKIKPFLTILYSIVKLEYLTKNELKYIIPLAKSVKELKKDVKHIEKSRKSGFNIDYLIRKKISKMDNYQEALKLLKSRDKIDIDDFLITMMNRKSSKYSKKYYKLYKKIVSYYNSKNKLNNSEKKERLFNVIKVLKNKFKNSKAKSKLLKKLIDSNRAPRKVTSISDDNIDYFENTNLLRSININKLIEEFFYICHVCKWKANLEEYYDLHLRLITLTDIFLIENGKIKLDIIPHFYFKKNIDDLIEEELIYDFNEDNNEKYFNKFHSNQEKLKDISTYLDIDVNELYIEIKNKYPEVTDGKNLRDQLQEIVTVRRIDRFNNLIESHFKEEQLIELLNNIKDRKDKKISEYIDWDADIPTIFEYLIGISWYLISDQKGDLSDFLNLKLNANLLPVKFASGGMGDIEFEYPDHDLIIEVTLTKKTNQRRLELEPVTRHLGNYMIENNSNSYAIFIAPYLDPNVLVNFRAYKNLKFYNTNNTKEFVENLKIIPLSIDDIIYIINSDIDYDLLNCILDKVFNHDERDGFKWYNKILKPKLKEI